MLFKAHDSVMDEERFQRAMAFVLRHEGGYVNDYSDKGGETKYGISKRSYPEVDIKSLTINDALAIYRRDFWKKYKYSLITDINLVTKIFDLSVNMGPYWAHCLLQRALRAAGQDNIVEDGIIGPRTLEATNKIDAKILLAALRAEAAGYYRAVVISKKEQGRFLQGWLNRAYS